MTAATPFTVALQELLNRESVENESNTPDFILAQYLRGCLHAWNMAVRDRDRWYGYKPWEREPLRAPDRDCSMGDENK